MGILLLVAVIIGAFIQFGVDDKIANGDRRTWST